MLLAPCYVERIFDPTFLLLPCLFPLFFFLQFCRYDVFLVRFFFCLLGFIIAVQSMSFLGLLFRLFFRLFAGDTYWYRKSDAKIMHHG